MAEIINHRQSPTSLQSHTVLANHLGVPLHALHIFSVHLHATPHVVHKNPHNTAPPMLPCGKCANSSVTMQFFSLPSKSTCHVIWKPTIHGHPIFPHPIPFLTFLALAFTMLNLLLLFNLSFPSSTLLLWLSFGYQTGM